MSGRQVVPDAQVDLAVLEHALNWLRSDGLSFQFFFYLIYDFSIEPDFEAIVLRNSIAKLELDVPIILILAHDAEVSIPKDARKQRKSDHPSPRN